jgi:hypothetical protein
MRSSGLSFDIRFSFLKFRVSRKRRLEARCGVNEYYNPSVGGIRRGDGKNYLAITKNELLSFISYTYRVKLSDPRLSTSPG